MGRLISGEEGAEGNYPKNKHPKPPIFFNRPPPPPPKGGYSGFLGLKFSISGFWGDSKILARLISCSSNCFFGLNFFKRV